MERFIGEQGAREWKLLQPTQKVKNHCSSSPLPSFQMKHGEAADSQGTSNPAISDEKKGGETY